MDWQRKGWNLAISMVGLILGGLAVVQWPGLVKAGDISGATVRAGGQPDITTHSSTATGAKGTDELFQALFAQEPAEALVRCLNPGVGFRLVLAGLAPEALAGRWRVVRSDEGTRMASDAESGLTVRQTFHPVGNGAMMIETVLGNSGNNALELDDVWPLDWSFRIESLGEEGPYHLLTYKKEEDTWYGSTYWTGPDWTRVGKDWHHPGERTPSIRKFICPEDGQVAITGAVRKAHLDGDGVQVMILLGNKTIWQAELEGRDGRGIDPNVRIQVRRGDALRFLVHKRGHIFCDTTYWDPLVTYENGRRFQASASFSNKQGKGGWYYEMQSDKPPEVGLPKLYLFHHGLVLEQAGLPVGRSAELSPLSEVSVAVLADGADRSGLVLAMTDGSGWRLWAELKRQGILQVQIGPKRMGSHWSIPAGQSISLPPILAAAYQGPWVLGLARLQGWLESPPKGLDPGPLRKQLVQCWEKVFSGIRTTPPQGQHGGGASQQQPNHLPKSADLLPELDYWAMIQEEWRRQDALENSSQAYCRAAVRHLEKAQGLLADFQAAIPHKTLADWQQELEQLTRIVHSTELPVEQARVAYWRTRWLKRQIILSNPLMQFDKLLFCKRVPTSYSHLVMQYFGWRARAGGGIFILEKPGHSLACREILEGKLSTGNVLEPRLSYDAQRILFSYVELGGKQFDPSRVDNSSDEGFYHIYEVRVDGTGLRQLTSGPYDDLMPNELPDGGIVFCSTRRQGYARCFGAQFSRRWHVYTLHRMDADGSNIRTLSWHDTNEWFPTVSPMGEIVYARWDYIDRDAVTHQNLWVCRPDGSNPRALWGNATSRPHCAFQAQAIPGTSKYIFTGSPHHSITAGSIAIIDPAVGPDGHAGLQRITPEIPFPEAESRDIREYYASPWPLSETYYLVSYSPKPLVWEPGANDPAALGIYYLDQWGNRELIYRDPSLGSESPCPLTPRPVPPVLKAPFPPDAPPSGEMVLVDVYQGLGDVPRGTIKSLRIVQIFPKTTHVSNTPPIGLAGEENARAILGTVPVERDGSARFIVPARKPILFQALDEEGFAYQTMRTLTYIQPGEQISCIGCHEHRRTAPPAKEILAFRRPASPIEPGLFGGRPFSYVEVVQPILDKHCVRCHDGEKPPAQIDLTAKPDRGFNRSYWTLCGDVNFWGLGTNPDNAAKALVPRFGARNQVQITPPGGLYGARGSRLLKILRAGHEGVLLEPDELARLAAWIDLNAIFYGVYLPEDQARQLAGEQVPMPQIQ